MKIVVALMIQSSKNVLVLVVKETVLHAPNQLDVFSKELILIQVSNKINILHKLKGKNKSIIVIMTPKFLKINNLPFKNNY